MLPFAVLNLLLSDVKKDDFSGFVDTCGTDKRDRAWGARIGKQVN